MTEFLSAALALAAGLFLGAIFFGGLWWTIRRGMSSPRPALWFFASLLLRTGITLAGIYLVGNGHWQRWLLCLLGFFLVRVVAWRQTRPSQEDGTGTVPEAGYAP